MPDGSERSTSYASKALNDTEKRYPQIDREALAIVWGVKKFFQYIYARKFTIYTDNKPISHIFSPKNTTSAIHTVENAKADILSRSPVDETCSTCPVRDDFNEFVQLQIQQTPLTSKNIARETSKDPHLSQIVQLLLNGRDLRTAGFTGREADYSLSEGCLLLGPRVVIPAKFQPQLLEELHVAHIGIVKMKALARSLVYWPSIDADIEKMAKSCQPCLKNAKLPSKFRSHHWEYPSAPWDCIHVDYCRPFLGKYILIVVDAFSKWMCAAITSNLLENWFSQFGVPSVLVSDNGPQFTSEFFKNFLKTQGVKFHKTSAVYHPSTNGQVERGVQTLKRALKDAEATPSSLQHCINNFLQYHKAPHQSAGVGTGSRQDENWGLHYEVESKGQIFRRHVDQLKTAPTEKKSVSILEPQTTLMLPSPPRGSLRQSRSSRFAQAPERQASSHVVTGRSSLAAPQSPTRPTPIPEPESLPTERRYPLRDRRPPEVFRPE
ncbi:Hypothetical protein NTJ_00211 [Nesidiocoris tenuis]|uniref:RNA-directed DNA polymerase n=1 Tax=Nesidiocoris tenuis TaxID=355587 RepID=A0ABN7A8E6_9HEMI|nr:Hypothetical protein NTJ_00211 [Nesidiocoris tenuis]